MKSFGIIGCILAAVLSWIVNQSVVWAIIHFFCSWIYVIYWLIAKTRFYDWLKTLVR